jgi:hypothetical protein
MDLVPPVSAQLTSEQVGAQGTEVIGKEPWLFYEVANLA